MTPAIKNADKLSVAALAAAIRAAGEQVHANKLSPDDMQGGTYTI